MGMGKSEALAAMMVGCCARTRWAAAGSWPGRHERRRRFRARAGRSGGTALAVARTVEDALIMMLALKQEVKDRLELLHQAAWPT